MNLLSQVCENVERKFLFLSLFQNKLPLDMKGNELTMTMMMLMSVTSLTVIKNRKQTQKRVDG